MSSQNKFAFFKQSGWMVIATFGGGIFMMLVQTVAPRMESEYAVFNALLRLLILLGGVPSAALQSVFAQQAAGAVSDEKHRKLTATTRAILKATIIFWIISGILVVVGTGPISRALDIPNPAALWLTVFVVLPTLLGPIFKGILQGMHHFAGLGWLQIIDGIGRFGSLILIFALFKATAASGIIAVSVGQFITLGIGAWLTREVWMRATPERMEWKKWLARAIPLTMGMGAVISMTCIDSLFVQTIFGREGMTKLYIAAMITGYAITMFIAPVASVMFPRIVRSAALAEKSDALLHTVAATGLFGCVAAIGCTIFPKLPLQIIFFKKPELWAAAPLVPWFAWSLLPMIVANVLIQSLLAQERFKAAPWIMAVPIVYTGTLFAFGPSLLQLPSMVAFTRVVQIMGLFSLLSFVISAWFTWHKPAHKK